MKLIGGLPPLPRTQEEREAFRARIQEELPHFAYHLLEWEVPEEVRGRRFKVGAYANQKLIEPLQDTSPDEELFYMIQTVLFSSRCALHEMDVENPGHWSGSASALKDVLLSSDKARQLDYFCRSASALGTRLGVLRKKYPEHVKYDRNEQGGVWFIKERQVEITLPGEKRAGRSRNGFDKAKSALGGR